MPKSSPNLSSVLHLLANSYQQMEDYKSAAGVYRELTVIAPGDFVAFNNLAYILCENLERAEEAVEIATKALELAPDENAQKSNVLDTLGWAMYKVGDLDGARLKLSESVRYEAGLHNQLHLAKVLIEKELHRDARLQLRNLRRTAQKEGNADFVREAENLLETL
jgi:Tfp pilus assembly protein PilF